MAKHPVVHFEIAGSDYGKTKEFYSRIFDWEVQEWEGGAMEYAMIGHSGEGTIGGGLMGLPRETGKPHVTIYIQVDDLKEYLSKIEAGGGKVISPPHVIPGVGSSAMFADPDGNIVGLYSDRKEVD